MSLFKILPAFLIATTATFTGFVGFADALVVEEDTSAGVTIIRNVKTFTSSNVQSVHPKANIGSSILPKPRLVLNEEDLIICNRRLKTIGDDGGVRFGRTAYCQ